VSTSRGPSSSTWKNFRRGMKKVVSRETRGRPLGGIFAIKTGGGTDHTQTKPRKEESARPLGKKEGEKWDVNRTKKEKKKAFQ